MKHIVIIILIITTSLCCNAQTDKIKFTHENFEEQILKYIPKQNEISKSKFSDGLKFLNETKQRVRKNNKRFDLTDYWNILTIFNNFNETDENIEIAFQKFSEIEGSCEYLISFKSMFNLYKESIRIKMVEQTKLCESTDNIGKNGVDIEEYIEKRQLNKSLVELIQVIGTNDQKHRNDHSAQKVIDEKNQILIDSLYKVYKTYIGKTLVGSQFEYVMWQVIQHSNLAYMEKYLPVVSSAVKNKELKATTLKYLIDRVFSEKFNYQIFGSQNGVKMADEKIRNEIIKKYGIE